MERGYDPRSCTLVAFGGAGPLHATQLAQEMGITTVLVPESPGILCALGLLLADVRGEFSQSHPLSPMGNSSQSGGSAFDVVEGVFSGLEKQASEWVRIEGIDKASTAITRVIEARYVGQGHQVQIIAEDKVGTPEDVQRLVEQFHSTYEQENGYSSPDMDVEFVNFRLQVSAPGPRPKLRISRSGDGNHERALIERRSVFLGQNENFAECPIYWRPKLQTDDRFVGPAVIEQMDSTTLILPGQEVYVDQYRNLIISIKGASDA